MSTLTPFVTSNLRDAAPCDPDEFLIVREDFSGAGSGGFNAYWNDNALRTSIYSPNTAQLPFPTAASVSLTPPSGNTYIANYFYKLAEASDTTSLQASIVGVNFTERYVRWNEYYSPGFLWPQSQKLSRIGNTSGLGPTADFIPVATDGFPDQQLQATGYDAETATTLFGGTPCAMSGFIPTGQWVKMSYYFRKSSAPNVADGRWIVMIEGQAACDYNNVITNTTGNNPYNFLWVGGNNTWNGNGPGLYTSVPQNQNRYLDNIEVFSALPCDVTLP